MFRPVSKRAPLRNRVGNVAIEVDVRGIRPVAFSSQLLALLTLTIQNTALVLLTKYSYRTAAKSYSTCSVVATSEVLKLVFSCVLSTAQDGKANTVKALLEVPRSMLRLGLPALLYVVQNSLLFEGLRLLQPTLYVVCSQMKILTSAFFGAILLKKPITHKQLMALLMLVCGTILVQTDKETSPMGTARPGDNSRLKGVAIVFTAALTSGFTGTYLEKLYKDSELSVWARNVQLACVSLPVAFLNMYAQNATAWRAYRPFVGYDVVVIAVIFCQAIGGMVVAVVLRNAGNVLKCFAVSISICVCVLLEVISKDANSKWSWSSNIGIFYVIRSTFLFCPPSPHYHQVVKLFSIKFRHLLIEAAFLTCVTFSLIGNHVHRESVELAAIRRNESARSSHTCFAGRYCKFHNICLSHDKQWLYFTGFAGPFEFDEVVLHPSPQFTGRRANIIVTRGFIPHTFKQTVAGIWTEMDLYSHTNRAHVMGDNVFALFQSATLAQVPTDEVNVILEEIPPVAEMFRLLTFKPPIKKDSLERETCYATVLLGCRGLGYVKDHPLSLTDPVELPATLRTHQLVARGERLMQFRQVVLRHFNLQYKRDPIVRMVLVEKHLGVAEHKSYIVNIRELMAGIKRKFKDELDVSLVCWQGMPLRAQIDSMKDADILMSLPGSDVMNAVFMPPVSAMILPNRYFDMHWEDSNEVRLWFRHIPGRYVDEYKPVVQHTSKTGAMKLNLNETLAHVDAALWYVQSNRYSEIYSI